MVTEVLLARTGYMVFIYIWDGMGWFVLFSAMD